MPNPLGTEVPPAKRVPQTKNPRPPRSGLRRDIQALRALAVGLVLLYHLWPARVRGGFVGVDVFFVLSGFLITSHLLRSPVTSMRQVLDFWARRIRRLIPVAALVLLVTAVAVWLFMPLTTFHQSAQEITASMLYFQNWQLAWSATDYLAADGGATPLQHYWSLSIEEQFYIVWPLVFAGIFWLARKTNRTPLLGLVFTVLTIAMFTYSIYALRTNPQAAYFISPARFWEITIGAMLALAVSQGARLPDRFKVGAAWLGIVAILIAGFFYSAATPFPGVAALLPVLGTGLVVLAAIDNTPSFLQRMSTWPPVQKLGDISYSIYLWHWPLIIIAPQIKGDWINWRDKFLILAFTIGLSLFSYHFVEERFRAHAFLRAKLSRTYIFLIILIIPVLIAATGLRMAADREITAGEAAAQALTQDPESCVGAAAAVNPDCDISGDQLLTSPVFAASDKSVLYADECWNNRPFTSRTICTYGTETSDAGDSGVRVALLGNSHAGHWQPAMMPAIEEQGWSLDTYLVSQCYTIELQLAITPEDDAVNCLNWNRWAIDTIVAGQYDLVVMSNRSLLQISGVEAADKPRVAREAYTQVLDQLTNSGAQVLVMRDTPAAESNLPECLEANPDNWAACNTAAAKALEDDPLAAAGLEHDSGQVTVGDFSHIMCEQGQCLPVIGGVIVYFDHGHLSATFAQTLSPYVGQLMNEALAGAANPTS